MFCSILSAALQGVNAVPVQVEADVADGMPQFVMVGSVSLQVKEGQDRVKTALRNTGIVMPPKRITVSLVPADIRKEGSRFDLAVAAAVLVAAGRIPQDALKDVMLAGEVRLNGNIQAVSGILPTVLLARELGCRCCMIPAKNVAEGQAVDGIAVIGIRSVDELIRICCDPEYARQEPPKAAAAETVRYPVDFEDIQGQLYVKRAALIAACGFHNLLLCGTPGSGKSMIAQRIPTIMPELSREESLELSKIYSVAGLLPAGKPLIRQRPFRAPHHTITPQALAGGGKVPVPGEVTLAHRGVLFLDELAEVQRHTIELLRQPLEEKQIVISRMGGTCVFPAAFMLVAAMNPCPCGYYPDMDRCTCSHAAVSSYMRRLSQPLLDRIDLSVEVPPMTYEELTGKDKESVTSADMRRIVTRVHALQADRYRSVWNHRLHYNSELTAPDLEKYCPVTEEGQESLENVFKRYKLSARGYHRIIKVARTIADIAGDEVIGRDHIEEAVCYKSFDKNHWKL